MRLRRFLLVALGLVLFLAAAAWWLVHLPAVWDWGGQFVIDLARDRIDGEVKVGEVKGYPLTGFTFTDVEISNAQGEVLKVGRVEMRFSLWSFVRLQPVIARLAFIEPHLTILQDQEGNWNLARLLKKRPPPPFDSVRFANIVAERGDLTFIRPGETRRFGDLALELDLTLLHPRRPNQEIYLKRGHVAADTPLGHLALETRLVYAPQRMNLESLELSSGESRLAHISGEVDLEAEGAPGRFALEVGPLAGNTLQRLWPGWPQAGDVQGKFHLNFSHLSRLDVSGEGRFQQASYGVKGNLARRGGDWGYDFDISLGSLKPDLLAIIKQDLGQKVKDLSPFAARLRLQGEGLTSPAPSLDWSLSAEPFQYRKARVEQLQLHLTGNGREQSLTFTGRGNFGRLDLETRGPLLADPHTGDLKVQAADFQPALLGLEKAEPSRLNGRFAGNFRLPGIDLSRLRVAGELEARGEVARQRVEDCKARLAWEKPRLEVSQANLRLPGVNADLKGTLEGERVDCQFRVSSVADGASPYLPAGLKGKLEGAGTVKGIWREPQIAFEGSGQGLAWRDLALKACTFKAAFNPPSLASGSLELRGTGFRTPAADFAQVGLNCRGEGQRWRLQVSAATPQGPQAEALGTADLQPRPALIALDKVSFRSADLTVANTRPVRLKWANGVELEPAVFKVNEGELRLSGQAQGGKLAGSIEGRDLPAQVLSPKGVALKGVVRGQVNFSGEPKLPVIQGKVTWGPGRIGGFSFQTMQSELSYREGELRVNGALEEKAQGPRLSWEGRIPFNLAVFPFRFAWGERDLNFRVHGEKANLSLLTALTPEVQAAEGPLDITAEWQGRPPHPKVSGQLRWGPGSVKLRVTGQDWRLLPGQANLQGESLKIPGVTFESGGGTFVVAGDIALKGIIPQQADVRGQVQDFLTLRKSGTEVRSNGTVALKGPWTALKLTGQLTATKGTFTTGFFQTAVHEDIVMVKPPPPPKPERIATLGDKLDTWKNLTMDVGIEGAPHGVWYKDRRMNIEMTGKLKAFKQPGDRIFMKGTIRAVRGTVEVQGRPFKVEEATLTLPGRPNADVILEGRATTQMQDHTFIMSASGPVGKPTVQMSSVPPLPPPDLLAYLVFGRPAASLSREEYSSLSQQALGVVGGIGGKKLQDILGKDFPLVGNVTMKSAQQEGRQITGVTKPITNELSVSLERKTSPLYREDINQVRVEYKVNKYFSLESTAGKRSNGGDVLFNLDF